MSEVQFNASVILNLHNEAPDLLEKTFISLDAAADLFRRSGATIELVIVLDNALTATRQAATQREFPGFGQVKTIVVENGSLGPSRNAGIAASRGEYLFTADGDDLISDNYFVGLFGAACQDDHKTLFFPEYLFGFDRDYLVAQYYGLSEIGPFSILESHPFISRVCAHRSVFEAVPYADLRTGKGYAFEDWHFNCNAVAHGCMVRTVPNVVLFYRLSATGLLEQALAQSSRQIAGSELFRPSIYREFCDKLADKSDVLEARSGLDTDWRDNRQVVEQVSRAELIEPKIRYDLFSDCVMIRNRDLPQKLGLAYYNIVSIIRDFSFADIVLFGPAVAGRQQIIDLVWSLFRQNPQCPVLLLADDLEMHGLARNVLPPNVIWLGFQIIAPELTLTEKLTLTLKVLQTMPDTVRLHLCNDPFSHAILEKYLFLFSDHPVFYHFDRAGPADDEAAAEKTIRDNITIINRVISWSGQHSRNLLDHVPLAKLAALHIAGSSPIDQRDALIDAGLRKILSVPSIASTGDGDHPPAEQSRLHYLNERLVSASHELTLMQEMRGREKAATGRLREQLHVLQRQLEHANHQISLLQQQNTAAKDAIDCQHDRLAVLQGELQSANSQVTSLQEDLAGQQRLMAELPQYPVQSRAFRLAALYTQSAKGASPLTRMSRFGLALAGVIKRRILRRLQ